MKSFCRAKNSMILLSIMCFTAVNAGENEKTSIAAPVMVKGGVYNMKIGDTIDLKTFYGELNSNHFLPFDMLEHVKKDCHLPKPKQVTCPMIDRHTVFEINLKPLPSNNSKMIDIINELEVKINEEFKDVNLRVNDSRTIDELANSYKQSYQTAILDLNVLHRNDEYETNIDLKIKDRKTGEVISFNGFDFNESPKSRSLKQSITTAVDAVKNSMVGVVYSKVTSIKGNRVYMDKGGYSGARVGMIMTAWHKLAQPLFSFKIISITPEQSIGEIQVYTDRRVSKGLIEMTKNDEFYDLEKYNIKAYQSIKE